MKVSIIFLAFLVIMFSLLPYALSSCNKLYDHAEDVNLITVYNKDTDEIVSVDIEEYLVGVVSAEMPASFMPEALKAQAVAARTYAMRKVNKGLEEHKGADLCTDFAHCQAYNTKEQSQSAWGKNYNKYSRKITDAVMSTSGECLTFDDEFAITVFHSCSNGITEKASDVWGGEIEYLINVESQEDTNREGYTSTLTVPKDEFINKIKDFIKKDINPDEKAIGEINHTNGNNVSDLNVFGNLISGVDMRKLFGLKSTAFCLEESDNEFVFTVSGNGHGVGMSQYGADYMAKQNKDYIDILYHYYPGTKLTNLNK